MRHSYRIARACPKGCGSQDAVRFTYCCADTFDVVCQGCGFKEVHPVFIGLPGPGQPYGEENPLLDGGESISAEIGFVGKEDRRKDFNEIFPGLCPPATIQ